MSRVPDPWTPTAPSACSLTGLALAAYVGVLPGRGPAMTGAIIGLRVMALAEPADVDVTVSLASVSERLAGVGRRPLDPADHGPGRLGGRGPPRSGWEVVGDLSVEDLKTVATQGIAEITRGSTLGSGARVVEALRRAGVGS